MIKNYHSPYYCSHDENVPLGTFSQDAKYVVPCTFRDIFDVTCRLSGAKSVFVCLEKAMLPGQPPQF